MGSVRGMTAADCVFGKRRSRWAALLPMIFAPGAAVAEVCDKARPDWDGVHVSAIGEAAALFFSPFGLLLLAFTSPAIQYVSVMRVRASVPSTTEIHHRAMDYASQREVGPHWGMAEVYSQMRRVQAGRLGHSYRTLK